MTRPLLLLLLMVAGMVGLWTWCPATVRPHKIRVAYYVQVHHSLIKSYDDYGMYWEFPLGTSTKIVYANDPEYIQ